MSCPVCDCETNSEWCITYRKKNYHYNCLMLNRNAIFAELKEKVDNLAIDLVEKGEVRRAKKTECLRALNLIRKCPVIYEPSKWLKIPNRKEYGVTEEELMEIEKGCL